MDSISLGPVPCDEACQQIGMPSYDPVRALLECQQYRDLLVRTFGEPPVGARYKITSNQHEAGPYYDVEILFDERNKEAIEFAFRVEGSLPANWDGTARSNLGLNK